MQNFVGEYTLVFDRRKIPCTRYDEDGDNERVREALNIAFGYAVAKVGGIGAEREFHCLQSIHDYKGILKVHYERPLSPLLVEAINEAWTQCDETEIIYYPATL